MAAELAFNCGCAEGHCLDPKHHAFWEPENWPGGQAPCRWEYTDREYERVEDDELVAQAVAEGEPAVRGRPFIKDGLSVNVWVPDYCVGDGLLATNLWWSSQSAYHCHPSDRLSSAVQNVRAWIRMERELDAELTPLIDAHRDLEEVRELPGAFPA